MCLYEDILIKVINYCHIGSRLLRCNSGCKVTQKHVVQCSTDEKLKSNLKYLDKIKI